MQRERESSIQKVKMIIRSARTAHTSPGKKMMVSTVTVIGTVLTILTVIAVIPEIPIAHVATYNFIHSGLGSLGGFLMTFVWFFTSALETSVVGNQVADQVGDKTSAGVSLYTLGSCFSSRDLKRKSYIHSLILVSHFLLALWQVLQTI